MVIDANIVDIIYYHHFTISQSNGRYLNRMLVNPMKLNCKIYLSAIDSTASYFICTD